MVRYIQAAGLPVGAGDFATKLVNYSFRVVYGRFQEIRLPVDWDRAYFTLVKADPTGPFPVE